MKDLQIKNVSCVGAGVIGYSWALSFAFNGLNTTLYDIKQDYLDVAQERIHTSIMGLVENDVVKISDVQEIEDRITFTTDMKKAVENADFIQENGPEHYEVKHEIVKEIEKWAPENAIIASSTSGLLITKIAEYAEHPERFVGGHPYNPPHLIPLVEITKGDKTSQWAVDGAYKFYKDINKEPVILNKEAPGFICNRIQMAVLREICHLVMSGVCSIEDADKAVVFGPGIRWAIMGPDMIFDLGGGDTHIDGLLNHLNDSIDTWLEDMADFKSFPDEFPQIARDGVVEALEHRDEAIGNDSKSLQEYRDHMLIEILKLHNKL